MIQIDPWMYLLGALLLLTLPLDWLLAAVVAAAFHEACHLAALYFFKGKVRKIDIQIGGAVIEADLQDRKQKLTASLAGPAGSLVLLLFCHRFPKLALCACVQGVFNLLPVLPLDGGRALEYLLELVYPEKAQRIQDGVQAALLAMAVLLTLVGMFVFSLGVIPVIFILGLTAKAIFRKRPCKRRRIGVQ